LSPSQENLVIQRMVVVVAVLLLAIKFGAYLLTGSVAVLTDALESLVNVSAGFIGLFSLYIAAQPKDKNHPYGHGKAEFLSAGVEGSLIIVAGSVIVYKSAYSILYPQPIQQLDWGIGLIAFSALVNFFTGYISVRKGNQNNSPALVASGKHLQTDTYSTIGIIVGLTVIYFTNIYWLDGVVGILFAIIILITGYRILRKSIAGMMDEADYALLQQMVDALNKNRQENWVDIHNLRVIKYGGQLHVDCHLTLPWYMNIREAHREVEALGALIRKDFGNTIELFVHSDGCLYTQCAICSKQGCPVRQSPFEKRIEWTRENLLNDEKHSGLPSPEQQK